jgi:sortase A
MSRVGRTLVERAWASLVRGRSRGGAVREWFGAGRGRLGLYALGAVALLVVGVLAMAVGTGMLSGAGADPSERAIQPVGAEKSTPEPVAETTNETEHKGQTEKKPEQKEGSDRASTSESASASASASSNAPASVPADATMSLTVPAMGISDVPVVEGTTEASLSAGAGHYVGSGYPWVPGSNTYIAGHRLGYPGTPSDHVFWNLPNLGMGDKIYLTDSNGHTYTYVVSDILEVPINDLSVTGPTGASTVSLQTCIEDYGDYWTPGPNWNVRYIVRGTMV